MAIVNPSMFAALVIASCVAATAANAAAIRGVVRLPESKTAASVERVGERTSRNSVSEAVVYLEETPEKLEKQLAKKLAKQLAKKAMGDTLVEKDHHFVPRVLPVVVGSKVCFENRDGIYHSVFSVSPAKRFDLGKHSPGESREVVFDRAGLVQLYCDIDRVMSGFVLVLPNQLFVRPDATGAFEFPKLPRGSYTLKVWHPTFGGRTRTVEIPRKGDAVIALSY